MRSHPARTQRPPLDAGRLHELALGYVGRFATTRAKLRAYLGRKLRERGWEGPDPPDLDALAESCVRLGYVDDRTFALARSRSLSARGFGPRRVQDSLRAAGIKEADGDAALSHAAGQAVDAALRFAERRRLGPFASAPAQGPARERALAALVRAGHAFALARAIVDLAPGSVPDRGALRHVAGLTED
ncbi:MAG TPA: RecX family transcriptional regulator [Sphingomicrobium sp.]|nr:RecX family transcriptional regulator [Sphingomicrobium sp.]